MKNKSNLKFLTVIAVMLVSIMILTGCGTDNSNDDKKGEESKQESAFEEPIKNYVEGLQTSNLDTLVKAFPSFISDELKEQMDEEDLKEMIDEAKEEYGENLKLSYEINDKQEIAEEDLKEKQEDIKTLFDTDITITKGYTVETKLTTKGDKEEHTETSTFEVYEIDGSWYMLGL